MFGRKNKNAASGEAENAAASVQDANGSDSKKKRTPEKQAKKESRKKKKNDLLKIFDESVWESVLEDLKANKNFVVKGTDGSPKYIALLFDTNAIGGLTGKEAKKDESKGSIIEAVRTGRIKTFIRNELLMDDLFIIIPDKETFENMDEFVVLTGVDFVLCSISGDGDIVTETENGSDDPDDPEITVSYSRVAEIVNEDRSVAELLPYYDSGRGKDDAKDSDSPDGSDDTDNDYDTMSFDEDSEILDDPGDDFPSDDDLESAMHEMDHDDGEGSGDDVPSGEYDDLDDYYDNLEQGDTGEDLAADSGDEQLSDGSMEYGDAQEVQAAGDEGGYVEFEDVTSRDVQEFVVRRFYSDDLGLEVSSQPFDAQFVNGNPYILFNEDRGTGWLNEYISNMAKDANTRMERLHTENLYRLREVYMQMIQKHCEAIAKTLSIADDKTQYGRMRFAIERVREDNLGNVSALVVSKREQLDTRWDETLEQVGIEAAASARRQYIDMYGKAHEDAILQIETRVKDEIERDYQNSLRAMNEDRQREASKLLDIAISETLHDMSGKYLNVMRGEKIEYVRIQNEITRFIDDNRKDEKARIEVLAEEAKNKTKLADLQRDMTAKMQSMNVNFEEKKAILQADIERMRREHEIYIENSKTDFASRIDEERAHSAQLQQQVDELLEKYRLLDEQKNAEYGRRIKELEGMIQSKDDDIGHITDAHKRTNMFASVGVVAAVVAAIGIGFMLGSFIKVRDISHAEVQGIYRQVSSDYDSQGNGDNDGAGADMLPAGK